MLFRVYSIVSPRSYGDYQRANYGRRIELSIVRLRFKTRESPEKNDSRFCNVGIINTLFDLITTFIQGPISTAISLIILIVGCIDDDIRRFRSPYESTAVSTICKIDRLYAQRVSTLTFPASSDLFFSLTGVRTTRKNSSLIGLNRCLVNNARAIFVVCI